MRWRLQPKIAMRLQTELSEAHLPLNERMTTLLDKLALIDLQAGRAIISQKIPSTAPKAGKPNQNHTRNKRE